MNNYLRGQEQSQKVFTATPVLYTRAEVAKMCGVSPDTVRRWVREGRLTPTRLTLRSVRFSSEELTRFIREQTTQGVTARPKP